MSKKAKKEREEHPSTTPTQTSSSSESSAPPEQATMQNAINKLPQIPAKRETHWLLSLSLSIAVPNEIDELYQMYRSDEGIEAWKVAEAIQFSQVLAERGDVLLFKGKREGETAAMFVGLARALAVMSFVSGGVPFADERFDALQWLSGHYELEELQAFCKKALHPYFDSAIHTIPVSCWVEGNEPYAIGTSFNAAGWFEKASNDDLLHLLAQNFRGSAAWTTNSDLPSGYENSLLSTLYEQAQDRIRWRPASEELTVEMLGDQYLVATRNSSQKIEFQVDLAIASAWLSLYKHALLTGEHWLLPPPVTRPKRKHPAGREDA